MKRNTILLLFLSLVLIACQNKRQMIIGKWHAVKLENPDMDTFFIRSQQYIDTVGKGHDDNTNIRLYGVANMDSMRHILQGQYDSAKAMQMAAVVNTTFDFRKDSTALLSFNGNIDSSKWEFVPPKSIILDELNGKGAGDKLKMEIVELSSDVLKLRFQENNATSTVTFKPEGK